MAPNIIPNLRELASFRFKYFNSNRSAIANPNNGKNNNITISLINWIIASLMAIFRKLSAKPNLDDYEYIEDPGFYIHKKTKDKYCGNCVDKHDKLHRLSFHAQKGLICRPCGNIYVSPEDYQSAWKQATQNDKDS